jgi:hypothetical protein
VCRVRDLGQPAGGTLPYNAGVGPCRAVRGVDSSVLRAVQGWGSAVLCRGGALPCCVGVWLPCSGTLRVGTSCAMILTIIRRSIGGGAGGAMAGAERMRPARGTPSRMPSHICDAAHTMRPNATTITPSHHHTITPSHHHTIIPSHHHTITPSHHHTIATAAGHGSRARQQGSRAARSSHQPPATSHQPPATSHQPPPSTLDGERSAAGMGSCVPRATTAPPSDWPYRKRGRARPPSVSRSSGTTV